MNTLIFYSFNILILCLIIFGVGMFKPKWILFWMDKPGRLPITMVAMALFMIAAIMFGEGNKELAIEKAELAKQKPVVEEVPDLH